MKYNSYYRKIFKIKTKIKYLFDVIFQKKIQKNFNKDWEKFYSNKKNYISKTRKSQFDRFLKKLKKEKNDLFTYDKIYIKYINSKIGYGVFAKKNIPKNTVLNQYTGILNLDKKISKDNDSAFSFPDFKKYSINAQKRGNWTRFVNHCQTPNVEVWEYYLPDRPYIFFTVGPKNIKKNEQLTFFYGEFYWQEGDIIC